MQARLTESAKVSVDDTFVFICADHATTQEVRGHRNAERFGSHGTRSAINVAREFTRKVVAGFNPGRVGLAVSLS